MKMASKKSILLVTNYFPPEKGAAPNRMHTLASALGQNGFNVSVVCPLPNYPTGKIFKGFRGKLYSTEKTEYGEIHRLWVWPSNSANKIIRLFSMFSFSFSLFFYFLLKKIPATVFIQYSPIFIGYTAVKLSKIFKKKTILNVSDLWPLAGKEMGILKDGRNYSKLLAIEKYCYANSDLIIGQSEEILEHISKIQPEKKRFLYRNIPSFPVNSPTQKQNKEIRIVYAGLLGVAQGVLEICENIQFSDQVSFHIYGSGPEANAIQSIKKPHIYFHGEVERAVLHEILNEYDIALIPLTTRIYGSVPSKIFEYTRLGLPVLYISGGEGEKIVLENGFGWSVPLKDWTALQEFVDKLTLGELEKYPKSSVQKRAVERFDFEAQFREFLLEVDKLY